MQHFTVGVRALNFVLLMDVTFQKFSSFAIIQSHPIIQLLNQRLDDKKMAYFI